MLGPALEARRAESERGLYLTRKLVTAYLNVHRPEGEDGITEADVLPLSFDTEGPVEAPTIDWKSAKTATERLNQLKS